MLLEIFHCLLKKYCLRFSLTNIHTKILRNPIWYSWSSKSRCFASYGLLVLTTAYRCFHIAERWTRLFLSFCVFFFFKKGVLGSYSVGQLIVAVVTNELFFHAKSQPSMKFWLSCVQSSLVGGELFGQNILGDNKGVVEFYFQIRVGFYYLVILLVLYLCSIRHALTFCSLFQPLIVVQIWWCISLLRQFCFNPHSTSRDWSELLF